ncbi:hypothetical protein LSH36_237g04070 [Paralvinella palmiformis]|uniref:Uncharacterized protein n=1 Tax=Paralvinella palmiformis TaxID=53620 RepID=A0AAD9JLS2_9ANNE|nr:hypothetical protein LSH36_237g04070 [Paralvinella palmiformis]
MPSKQRTITILCSIFIVFNIIWKTTVLKNTIQKEVNVKNASYRDIGDNKFIFGLHCKQTNLSENVTIVTSFFNIGTFRKGAPSLYYSPEKYYKWMESYRSMFNPVIAFFDNDTVMKYFQGIRQPLGENYTKTFLVQRSDMWAFNLRESISRIFKKPGYPKYHPNTVVPEYSCLMHAKYEAIFLATEANFFCTQYFAWIDIGYFRKTSMSPFEIWIPPNYNSSLVAYTEISSRKPELDPKGIVYSNAVWVAGGFFIGEVNVIRQWAETYMRATEMMIRQYELISTDQQVLYVLGNSGQMDVRIQTYRIRGNWFYLGYMCAGEGKKRHL